MGNVQMKTYTTYMVDHVARRVYGIPFQMPAHITMWNMLCSSRKIYRSFTTELVAGAMKVKGEIEEKPFNKEGAEDLHDWADIWENKPGRTEARIQALVNEGYEKVILQQ